MGGWGDAGGALACLCVCRPSGGQSKRRIGEIGGDGSRTLLSLCCHQELREDRPQGLETTSGDPLLPTAVMGCPPGSLVTGTLALLPSVAETTLRIEAGWTMLPFLHREMGKTLKMLHILLRTSRNSGREEKW